MCGKADIGVGASNDRFVPHPTSSCTKQLRVNILSIPAKAVTAYSAVNRIRPHRFPSPASQKEKTATSPLPQPHQTASPKTSFRSQTPKLPIQSTKARLRPAAITEERRARVAQTCSSGHHFKLMEHRTLDPCHDSNGKIDQPTPFAKASGLGFCANRSSHAVVIGPTN